MYQDNLVSIDLITKQLNTSLIISDRESNISSIPHLTEYEYLEECYQEYIEMRDQIYLNSDRELNYHYIGLVLDKNINRILHYKHCICFNPHDKIYENSLFVDPSIGSILVEMYNLIEQVEKTQLMYRYMPTSISVIFELCQYIQQFDDRVMFFDIHGIFDKSRVLSQLTISGFFQSHKS